MRCTCPYNGDPPDHECPYHGECPYYGHPLIPGTDECACGTIS